MATFSLSVLPTLSLTIVKARGRRCGQVSDTTGFRRVTASRGPVAFSAESPASVRGRSNPAMPSLFEDAMALSAKDWEIVMRAPLFKAMGPGSRAP